MSLLEAGTTIARYTVLGSLATGGMSELYLARQAGPSGFHKILVLKVILPQHAEDPRFVKMFENEARLAAMLNHPGVVQVYDFGVEQRMHYLAMEYIDGLPLHRVSRRLRALGQLCPLPLACRIVSDLCGALDHAHSLADANGRPLQIVHRDISLENILISYAGLVKLVDFGLARARALSRDTTQGTLKGKYLYMAPETLEGTSRVDHRVDIFALGVVLYALVTNQMPFGGRTHVEILRSIAELPPVAPRQHNPALPEELQAIVLHALEKDRARRYQYAKDMQQEIESWLARSAGASTYHLAQFVNELFPPGTDPSRKLYQQLAGVHSPVSASAETSVPATGSGPTLILLDPERPPEQAGQPRLDQLTTVIQPQESFDSAQTLIKPDGAAAATLKTRRRSWLGVVLLAVVACAAATAAGLLRAGRIHLKAGVADHRALPPPDSAVPADRSGAEARLPPDAAVREAAPVLAAASGRSKLRIFVWPWATVSLDGKKLGSTPLAPIPVTDGVHVVLVENDELDVRREIRVRVKPGKDAVVKLKLQP